MFLTALLKFLRSVLGEVAASPTSNTVLDRLKTLATLLAAPTAVDGGQNDDVDTSAEILASDTTCKYVIVQADEDNTDVVYVGGSTAQHHILHPLDAVVIPTPNLNLVYVKGGAANQKVNYIYVV